jgi:hypothetical protein
MIKKPKLGDIVWYIDCDNRYNLCKRCGGITDIFCKSEIEISGHTTVHKSEAWPTEDIPAEDFAKLAKKLIKGLKNDIKILREGVKTLEKFL